MSHRPAALEELQELIDPDKTDAYNDWLDRWLTLMQGDNSVGPEEADIIVGNPLKQRMISGAKHKIATVLHKQEGIFHVLDDFPRMEVSVLILRASPNEP